MQSSPAFTIGPASPPPVQPGEIASVDLPRLLLILRRRLRLFIAVALPLFAAVVLATLLATPRYVAKAQVILDPRDEKVSNVQDVLSRLPVDSSVVDTEVEVLRSRQLANRVVKLLALDKDPEFAGRGAAASPQRRAAAPASSRKHERVVNAVSRRLSVSRSGLTYIIDVGFESESPAKAARIANNFAALYIAQQLETKNAATRRAAAWLKSRIDDLRTQVLADESAVQQFKIANNLLSASGTTLTEQEISNYDQTLAQAKAQVAEDRARLATALRQLAKGSSGDDVGETLNSPTIQKLKEQRAEVSRRVATLQVEFLDPYPALKRARGELADIDHQIENETHRIISNLDAKVQVSSRRAAAVGASLGGAQSELAANNRASVRLNELERNAQASRTLYETYLARYKETSTQEGLHSADARLVSLASPPTDPSSPKVMLNLIVGLFFALGAGAGAVMIAEARDARLVSSADFEKRLRVRYLGAVPLLASVDARTSLDPIDYVAATPMSVFSEAYRSLHSSIVYGAEGGAPVKVVAITSALPGEGKTTTAICLGRACALEGAKVIVVDCDLRRRSLDRTLDTQASVGLLDVLAGRAALADAIVRDTCTDADFLVLTDGPTTPENIFAAPAVDRLLVQLRSHYDLVILDTAPLLPVADTRALARKSDFVLLVARWRATPYEAVEGALRLLAGSNAGVSGIVLNQVDAHLQSGYDVGYDFRGYGKQYLAAPDHNAAG